MARVTASRRGHPQERSEGDQRRGGPPLYQRLVIKAGTNLLTNGTGHLDRQVMASLVRQVAALYAQGRGVLLVSSGAVAAGREVLDQGGVRSQNQPPTPASTAPDPAAGEGAPSSGTPHEPGAGTAPWSWELPFRQVLAAVGQGRVMAIYQELFAAHGLTVAQALVTRRDVVDRVGYLNIRNTLLSLLSLGVIPILNENDVVAVEELAGEVFGDNDTLSALVANIVDADLLVLLGDVGGLYTADPHTHPEARLIPLVADVDAVEAQVSASWGGTGRGGMVTKIEAARLAGPSGVTMVIADGRPSDALTRVADGEALGTWFPPSASRVESRRRWLLSASSATGAVVADSGAVRALRGQKRSLLAAGVREVQGRFQRGEVVPILGPGKERVAVGIVNYSDQELRQIQGQRSDRIGATLGYQYGAEVMHRNNMVVLQGQEQPTGGPQ